jgi:peptidyl-prolyl cis-trans isomerase C
VVGRFAGGTVSQAELTREASRLPPALREQFGGEAGRRELVRSLIDKKLLAREARQRGLSEAPDIKRQVIELEERLIIQSLLAAEEKSAGEPTEAELRAFFEAHKAEFEQPERVRVARALVSAGPEASAAQRAKAKARAEKLAERLRRGESAAQVAADGDGPERARGGDLGFLVRGESGDPDFEAAAFALKAPGTVSPVFATREGFAVLQLQERSERRVPSFEEVRSAVEGRVAPIRKRQVFDDLLAKLRRSAEVRVEVPSP